jgi:DNA-binding NarL/FixJ family response regulator
VGTAFQADVDAGRAHVPAHADAVLASRATTDQRAAAGNAPRATTTANARLFEELTPRERDVLALLSDGYGNRAIAERLGLSEHTVKFHLASIYGKLGASTRTEAVRRGLDLGIIDI